MRVLIIYKRQVHFVTYWGIVAAHHLIHHIQSSLLFNSQLHWIEFWGPPSVESPQSGGMITSCKYSSTWFGNSVKKTKHKKVKYGLTLTLVWKIQINIHVQAAWIYKRFIVMLIRFTETISYLHLNLWCSWLFSSLSQSSHLVRLIGIITISLIWGMWDKVVIDNH